MKTIADILPEIIEFRHKLHRIPELAGAEFKTQKAIRERLAKLDLEVLPPFIGTDTVALLHGSKGPGRNVTLRSEIDALKITEESGVEFTSEHPGYMHACGHDGHAAMLMGAAEILASRRDEFAGSIRFVWQPGEEGAALGGKLVAAGALLNPEPSLVAAIHSGGIPLGTFSSKPGTINGSSALFKVVVRGKDGHSACPHETIDPVAAACAIVADIQSIVSRRINPIHFAVISVCRIVGGTQHNAIPSEVEFEGTARSFDLEDDNIIERCFRETAECVARAHGATVEIDYQRRYPVSVNSPEAVDLARKVILRTFGEGSYTEMPAPMAGAEDFAYYLQKYPGVYAIVGMGENTPCGHTAKYYFNDETTKYGIEYFVNLALEALR